MFCRKCSFVFHPVQSQRGRGKAWGWGKAGQSAIAVSVWVGVTVPSIGAGLREHTGLQLLSSFLCMMGAFFRDVIKLEQGTRSYLE